MPPLVLEKIQREPLPEKEGFFSFFLEAVSQLPFDWRKHVRAPGTGMATAPRTRAAGEPAASRSERQPPSRCGAPGSAVRGK